MSNAPFSFDGILHASFVGILLCIGVALRGALPFFQRYLVPASLLGGLIGLALMQGLNAYLNVENLQAIAFHCMNISFIAIGLTPEKKAETTNSSGGVLWLALMQGITFPLQAIIGGGLTLLFIAFGINLHRTFGFFLPLGFNEGPGQALSIGKTWEAASFQNAVSIGLAFATLGYMASFILGVPMVRFGLRKRAAQHTASEAPPEVARGFIDRKKTPEAAAFHTIHAANADTLAFQLGLIGVVYALTYGLVRGLTAVLPADLSPILWGFFFFSALLVAMLVKAVIQKIGYTHLIDAEFQRRITGSTVDFLVISTVAAIEISVITAFLFPILLISFCGGVSSLIVVEVLGRKLKDYSLERRAVLLGTVTGTVTTGLLLLRMADPEFRTPVALEMAVSSFFVAPIILLCVFLVQTPIWQNWSIPLVLAAFGGVMALSYGGIFLLAKYHKI